MRTRQLLLLSTMIMGLAWVLSPVSSRAQEPAPEHEDDLRDALKQLDLQLSDRRESGELSADALSELEGFQSRLVQLREELQDREQSLAAAQAEITALETRISSVPSTVDAETQAQLQNMEDENRILKAEVEQLHRQLESVVSERDQVKADFDRLFKADPIAAQTDAEDIGDADLERIEAELAAVKDLLPGLRDSLAEARRDNEELRSANEEISQASTQLQEANAELQDAHEALRQELEAVRAAKPAAMVADDEVLKAKLQEMMEVDAERVDTLNQELAGAKDTIEQLREQLQTQQDRRPDVRESDLFKELEDVNALLREKLVDMEAARQQLARKVEAVEARDSAVEADLASETALREKVESELSEALAREEEYKELLETMVPKVRELEAQVTSLTSERQTLQNRLLERDEDLQALRIEFEKREHRLIKAERVAEVLEQARSEVLQAGEREKLNMHYNMAAVYAREGKFGEAEREYLQALRIDPADADVHYNLGILYEDELKVPDKAVTHYRRYLQLNPHGPDADRVRNWLLKLELQTDR